MECHVKVVACKLCVCAAALMVLSGCDDSGPVSPTPTPAASPAAPAPQPIPQGAYTVTGVVTTLVGGGMVPVEGVLVEDSYRHASVRTGADGSYTIREVGSGAAYFYIAKQGFRTQIRTFTLTGDFRLDI